MLRCVAPYRAVVDNVAVNYTPGEIIDAPALEAWLLADSPASFEVVEPEPQAERQAKPEQDRMLRDAPNRGRRRGGG